MNKPKPPTKQQQQSNTHTYPNPKFTEAFVQTLKYEQEDEDHDKLPQNKLKSFA